MPYYNEHCSQCSFDAFRCKNKIKRISRRLIRWWDTRQDAAKQKRVASLKDVTFTYQTIFFVHIINNSFFFVEYMTTYMFTMHLCKYTVPYYLKGWWLRRGNKETLPHNTWQNKPVILYTRQTNPSVSFFPFSFLLSFFPIDDDVITHERELIVHPDESLGIL